MATPASLVDPDQDLLPRPRRPLDAIFAPRTVAVIGASEHEDHVGHTILWNLISTNFGGTVFPVHPRAATVLGINAYPTIAAVPAAIDLAVIATPAESAPQLIGECVDAGVKGAIVVAAGFKDAGPAGVALEQALLQQVRRSGPAGRLRLIGPNCLGLMRPPRGLNATFANAMARPGKVAFISQSGALCTAVLDWSIYENIGFSAFISIGGMLDVDWGDLIDYLGDDPHTHSIIVYMEAIGDARPFLSAAREVARTKPIIVLKAGRTAGAARAALSHTGALAGSDAVLDAAFRRCGVLRVESIAELFYMAEVLAKQPRPKGPRLTILTNAGGPGVLAADALVSSGGQLAELSPATLAALDQVLPAHWSHGNPIDLLGDAEPQRYEQALRIVAEERNSDGVLVLLSPQINTDAAATAAVIEPYAKMAGTPLLASWMGGAATLIGEATLNRANIPTFPYPDAAARMFSYMWRYSDTLRSLYETPIRPADESPPDRARVQQLIERARGAGRTLLTEHEAKQVLAAYGLPAAATRLAASAEEAVAHAEAIGYPVVLKLSSATISHKTEVGGVRLQLGDAAAVTAAFDGIARSVAERAGPEHFAGVTVQPMVAGEGYELLVGATIDPQFGPVLVFGAGGLLAEALEDRALGLPPLSTTLARRMIEQTRIVRALRGVRGRPPIDLQALEQLLVRFSYLVVEQPAISAIEINPLLALPDRLVALDARVVLHGPEVADAQLPRPAIRPYPTQYIREWLLKDGTPVTIRPIRPEDEPLLVKLHATLSERSVFMRYFAPMSLQARTDHDRLTRMCFIDYDREMALVADGSDPATGERQILGVGRLIRLRDTAEAEFAVLINDQFQGLGLGYELLAQLVAIAREEGRIKRIIGEILPENRGMRRVCEKLGFRSRYIFSERVVSVVLDM